MPSLSETFLDSVENNDSSRKTNVLYEASLWTLALADEYSYPKELAHSVIHQKDILVSALTPHDIKEAGKLDNLLLDQLNSEYLSSFGFARIGAEFLKINKDKKAQISFVIANHLSGNYISPSKSSLQILANSNNLQDFFNLLTENFALIQEKEQDGKEKFFDIEQYKGKYLFDIYDILRKNSRRINLDEETNFQELGRVPVWVHGVVDNGNLYATEGEILIDFNLQYFYNDPKNPIRCIDTGKFRNHTKSDFSGIINDFTIYGMLFPYNDKAFMDVYLINPPDKGSPPLYETLISPRKTLSLFLSQ